MEQPHKLGLLTAALLLQLLLLANASAAYSNSEKNMLTGHSTPMESSLAFQFFDLASQQAAVANSTGIQLARSSEPRSTYDDALCDRDVARIRDAIHNMEEWALECKQYNKFTLIYNQRVDTIEGQILSLLKI